MDDMSLNELEEQFRVIRKKLGVTIADLEDTAETVGMLHDMFREQIVDKTECDTCGCFIASLGVCSWCQAKKAADETD